MSKTCAWGGSVSVSIATAAMKCATSTCEKRRIEMTKPPKQTGTPGKTEKFTDLPTLTEVSDTHANLPVLTEILADETISARKTAVPLSDAQCRQLAARIAPHLESLLRDKIASRLDSVWPEIWREVQAELPRLVRAHLAEPPRRSRK